MELREELQRRIEQKRNELSTLYSRLTEAQTRVAEAKAYIAALEDTLKLVRVEAPAALPTRSATKDSASASGFRGNSGPAQARNAILQAGKPLHIMDLLRILGKPQDRDSRSALSGSLAAYVRRGEVFSRPAPNTFGLIEMGHPNMDTEALVAELPLAHNEN